jgi:light-regulated signal transduction histidine kinase (bacteriophytochrome)
VTSHDLQEPLRMVTSFLTQLERKYSDVLDEKGKTYIHFAVDGAKRMRQLILDLLEYSRVGKMNEPLEEVDLNALMNDVVELSDRFIKEKNATVLVEKLPVVNSFYTPLRQVFLNLINNGLKYSSEERTPEIIISSKETPHSFQIIVRDNGIGIKKEYLEKIFIIFQRLHTREEYSGTGIGLAITKKLMEHLGGKIYVESDLEKGSSFIIEILKK